MQKFVNYVVGGGNLVVPEDGADKVQDGDTAMLEGPSTPSHDHPLGSRDGYLDEDDVGQHGESDYNLSDASPPTSTPSSISIASLTETPQPSRSAVQLTQSPAMQKQMSRAAPFGYRNESFEHCAPLFRLLRRTEWGRGQSIRADVVNLYSNVSHRKSLLRIFHVSRQTLEEAIGHEYIQFDSTLKNTFDFLYHLSRIYDSKDSLIRHHCQGILDFISSKREGLRWQELVDVVESQEILLIGSDEESENRFLNRELLSKDFMDNPTAIERQFRTYRGHAGFPFGAVVRNGTDRVFEKLKELLLDPDLKLKELGVALDGICNKMELLSEVDRRYGDRSSVRHGADTEKDAGRDLRQDTDTTKTLTRELEDRIEASFELPRAQNVGKFRMKQTVF